MMQSVLNSIKETFIEGFLLWASALIGYPD